MLVIKEKVEAESRLLKYIQSHYLPSRLTIILYLVDKRHPQYNRFPVNYLRSLGISNVRTSHYIVLEVVCTWRVLRKNRNRQFFDLSGLSSLLVLYLAMGANPPTSVPNYRLFWPCRKMNGNRSGFCVKPRQLHTTMLVGHWKWPVGGLLAMVSNGEH